jgi:hypothetical protein
MESDVGSRVSEDAIGQNDICADAVEEAFAQLSSDQVDCLV